MLGSLKHGRTPAGKTTVLCPSDQRPSITEAGFGKVEKPFDFVVLALHQTCFHEAERALHSQDRVAELMNHVRSAGTVGVDA